MTEGADALITQKDLLLGIQWVSFGASGAAPLNSGWVNQGAPYQVAQYGIAPDGTVHLRGLIKQTNTSLTPFTLPAGYRPGAAEVFNSGFGNSYVSITIPSTGAAVLNAISGGLLTGLYVSLSGIHFDPA